MLFAIHTRSDFPEPFLSIDEDGPLAKLASPRTSTLPNLQSRIETLLTHFHHPGIALTIEELCPGGLDASDGILIAQAFERAGAQFIIASGGTQDFPALKYRRSTRVLKENNHAWMSSAAWLLGRVKIPVIAQGFFDNIEETAHRAKVCGFSALLRLQK